MGLISGIKGLANRGKKAVGSFISGVGSILNSSSIAKLGARLEERNSDVARIVGTSRKYAPKENSAAEVERVNQILRTYTDILRKDMNPVHESIGKAIELCVQTASAFVEEETSKRRLKFDYYGSADEVRSSISRYVSDRMNCSDPACRRIMEMSPSRKKEEKMREYTRQVLTEAADHAAEELSQAVKDRNQRLLDEVTDRQKRTMEKLMEQKELLRQLTGDRTRCSYECAKQRTQRQRILRELDDIEKILDDPYSLVTNVR